MKLDLTEKGLLLNRARFEAYFETMLENQAEILSHLKGTDAGSIKNDSNTRVDEKYKAKLELMTKKGLLT